MNQTMEITVLVDNNTLIDNYLQGEPALSFLIKGDNCKILFDTGYSDLFLKNAKLLNENISDIDYLVLSHGHNDHTKGLKYLFKEKISSKINLVAHPDILYPKKENNDLNIGVEYNRTELENQFNLHLSSKPIRLKENLIFLGEIPRVTEFEGKNSIGYKIIDEQKYPDFLLDDSALVYTKNNEIIIITGCSHSGIINIIQYAKKVTQCSNIKAILGGFHLANKDIELINKTLSYLEKENIQIIYPCHCTGLLAKCRLMNKFNVEEVGTGLKLKF